MSSFQRLVIESNGTKADFQSQCNMAMGGLDAVQSVVDYIAGLAGGQRIGAQLFWKVGAVKASGTITVSSTGPTNGQTCTIAGVTLTAKTTGAGTNEFNINASATVVAANIAAAINASPDLLGIVKATSALGVVTVTAEVPGAIGNGLVIVNVNLSNAVFVTLASGSDGTAYSQNLK